MRKSLLFKRKVFWAVVPNKDLSIIHLASINCLKYLMRNGFDVYVLVYRKLPCQVDSCKVEFSAYSAGVNDPNESCGRSSLYEIRHQ